VDKDSFKGTGKKLKRNEHEGHVEEHPSSHVEDMCVEEDRTTTYDTPLEPIDEADDNSVLDGYDADEEDVLAPNHDVDSVPYDMYDVATMIVPVHD
jgi:hypothetical protein